MITAQEREERRLGIGGSDVAAVCGVSRFKTALQVYLDKTEGLETPETPSMRRGNLLEGFVRDLFISRTRLVVRLSESTLRHESYPYLLGHVDGFLPEVKGLLEIKTCGKHRLNEFGDGSTDEIPIEYLLQVQYYLLLTGCEVAYVPVLFGDEGLFNILCRSLDTLTLSQRLSLFSHDLDMRVFMVYPNLTLHAKLLEILCSFWRGHVLAKVPPEATTHDDLIALFPDSISGKKKNVSSETRNVIGKLKEAKELKKKTEETIERLENEVKAYMEDAEKIIDEDGSTLVSWKSQVRQLFDKAALMLKNPDLNLSLYRKTNTQRVLRIR